MKKITLLLCLGATVFGPNFLHATEEKENSWLVPQQNSDLVDLEKAVRNRSGERRKITVELWDLAHYVLCPAVPVYVLVVSALAKYMLINSMSSDPIALLATQACS